MYFPKMKSVLVGIVVICLLAIKASISLSQCIAVLSEVKMFTYCLALILLQSINRFLLKYSCILLID